MLKAFLARIITARAVFSYSCSVRYRAFAFQLPINVPTPPGKANLIRLPTDEFEKALWLFLAEWNVDTIFEEAKCASDHHDVFQVPGYRLELPSPHRVRT